MLEQDSEESVGMNSHGGSRESLAERRLPIMCLLAEIISFSLRPSWFASVFFG